MTTSTLTQTVASIAREAGIEKFTPEDAERFAYVGDAAEPIELGRVALVYALAYTGNFDYMVDMRHAAQRWGHLSNAQAKGVLNCMLAEDRRQSAAPRNPVTEVGMYQVSPTEIYKVQRSRESGRLYAKRLVLHGEGEKATFEYAHGAVYRLTADQRMSMTDAKACGAAYGVCCCCGALLTDPKSIEAGIGPICAGRL